MNHTTLLIIISRLIAFLFFLLLNANQISKAQECGNPRALRIFYMSDDPWGWLSDSSYPAAELIKDYPHCLHIKDSVTISLLLPSIDSLNLVKTQKSSDSFFFDTRFVVLIDDYYYDVDTVAFGSGSMGLIRVNNDYYQDRAYYNRIVGFIAKNDHHFRKWYRAHYHAGEWHFFNWRTEKKTLNKHKKMAAKRRSHQTLTN